MSNTKQPEYTTLLTMAGVAIVLGGVGLGWLLQQDTDPQEQNPAPAASVLAVAIPDTPPPANTPPPNPVVQDPATLLAPQERGDGIADLLAPPADPDAAPVTPTRVTATVETPQATTENTPSASVQQVVKRHMNQVRRCYEQSLKVSPTLAGEVVLQFVIAADGRVSSTAIAKNSLGNPAVGECIAGAAMRWVFPSPEEGAMTVSYPFLFSMTETP